MNQTIRPASPAEEIRMREHADQCMIVVGSTRTGKRLHIGFGDQPLCETEQTQRAAGRHTERGEPESLEYKPKDWLIFPMGCREICRFCVRQWRRGVYYGRSKRATC